MEQITKKLTTFYGSCLTVVIKTLGNIWNIPNILHIKGLINSRWQSAMVEESTKRFNSIWTFLFGKYLPKTYWWSIVIETSLLLKILIEQSFLTTLSRSGLHINGNGNRKDSASYPVVKHHFDLIEGFNFFFTFRNIL